MERRICTEEIIFHRPTFSELSYRQHLLSDAATMAYNIGYQLNGKNDHPDDGTICFCEEKWPVWYKRWCKSENERFYAYVLCRNEPVGEAYYHKSGETAEVGLVIEASRRRRGLGRKALRLLIKQAFSDAEIELLEDFIPLSRSSSLQLFLSEGFVIKERIMMDKAGAKEEVCRVVLPRSNGKS